MTNVIHPFQLLVIALAGWLNRQQQAVIDYLVEETRVLKDQLDDQRFRFTDEQRIRLAVKAKVLGRRALNEIETLVTADTLLAWRRKLVAKKWTYPRKGPGRPRVAQEITDLVLLMARENISWGYDRNQGALANLGHVIAPNTVKNILKRQGIEPAPERKKHTSWATFLKVHWSVMAATDFFTVEVWTVLSTWWQITDNITMNSLPNYRGYRFPPEIISHTVWLYHRFTLSLRDIEDLLAERNVIVSYESIRQWCAKFGLDYAKRLRKRRGPGGDRWFLDEVTVSIQGRRQYLWRAVDQDGDVLDILLQSRKDKCAAKHFFRKLLKGQERTPIKLTTDKLRSYSAAKREMMASVLHCQDKYANNRAEVSHEHTHEQERQMRGFASSSQAQRFLSVHGQVHNLFRLGRYLLRAVNYRILRGRAFATWQEITSAQ